MHTCIVHQKITHDFLDLRFYELALVPPMGKMEIL